MEVSGQCHPLANTPRERVPGRWMFLGSCMWPKVCLHRFCRPGSCQKLYPCLVTVLRFCVNTAGSAGMIIGVPAAIDSAVDLMQGWGKSRLQRSSNHLHLALDQPEY